VGNNLNWEKIANDAGFNNDKDMLVYFYETRKLGSRGVGKAIGVSRYTVLRKARELGIKVKPRGGRNNLHPDTDKFEREILAARKSDLVNMTSDEIIKVFSVDKSTFYKITRKHKIDFNKYGRNGRNPT
jgi:hypothetical protein